VSKRLPTYYNLLLEAQQASEAVDAFDVVVDTEGNYAAFDALRAADISAQRHLINFVRAHFEELIEELRPK
jgi:hypothetical protein